MATTEQMQMPALGQHGEPCAYCGSPLAGDQRYCLECGGRRTGTRVPLNGYAHANGSNGAGANGSSPAATADGSDGTGAATPPSTAREPSPLGAVLGIAALGAMLLIGVLIGRGNNDSNSAPPVVTVAGTGTAAGTSSGGPSTDVSATTVSDDWPQGKTGWTVEIGTLPKQGTAPADVDSAKQDAESKGATDVGVLVSDNYASLPPGAYVIYSGVYTSQSDANAALSKLKSDFPDAKVVEVSDQASSSSGSSSTSSSTSSGGNTVQSSNGSLTNGSQANEDQPVQASTEDLQALNNATGDSYEEAQQNLPSTIVTPGETAAQDNKPPGGSDPGDVQTFK